MDDFNPDKVLKDMLNTIEDRFIFNNDSAQTNSLTLFFPGAKDNIRVLRIKRKSSDTACWKTLLFAFEVDQQLVSKCFSWAASVQEELLKNESSDLYLFIVPNLFNRIPKENCIYIESNDQYCRKYVMRPDETFSELLNRTFLCQYHNDTQIGEISDPLVAALDKTGLNLSSFTSEEQGIWKNILLSNRQGIEIAEALIEVSLENSKNDAP